MNRPARIGSLCSGYGGLDMSVMDVIDAEVAWHAQYEPPDKNGKPDANQYAAQILAHHWPSVPNHGDITAIDYGHVEPVDIVTAGFPCTDLSLAGLQAGLREGTRSGIWRHVARAIGALRPQLVFIENVRSITSAWADSDLELCPWCLGDTGDGHLRALGCVLGDLADLGFDAEWCVLPASAVGAPHRRERCFIRAWPADAEGEGLERWRLPAGPARVDGQPRDAAPPAVQDSDDAARSERRLAAPGQAEIRGARPDARGRSGAPASHPPRIGGSEGRPEPARQQRGPDALLRGATDWGEYEPAVRRWEAVLGRRAPRPTDDRGRLDPAFAEWMMGAPEGHVTAVPGIPRAAQLHALGNGVVIQQGAAALRMLTAAAGL